jgi:hypothetical protein
MIYCHVVSSAEIIAMMGLEHRADEKGKEGVKSGRSKVKQLL